jgi:iron-sulfur cluster repair protein YtfE (RIC family)
VEPRDVRAKLLGQHARIRDLLHAAGEAAERDDGLVKRILVELRVLLLEHNRDEEELLFPLLRAGDDLAPRRISRMLEEHAAEHEAFAETIAGEGIVVAPETVRDLVEELDAHMQAEERTILSEYALKIRRAT